MSLPILVKMTVGFIELTRIFFGASSNAKLLVKASKLALLAEYTEWPANALSPARLEMFTIDEPSFKKGRSVWTTLKHALKFTFMTWSKSLSVNCSNGLMTATPALFTIPSSFTSNFPRISFVAFQSLKSSWIARNGLPLSSFDNSFNVFAVLDTPITWAPFEISCLVSSLPIPK